MIGIMGALFIGLGWPLAKDKVPPNAWYGVRVSRFQFLDKEIWYAVNRGGGKHLILLGAASLFFCVVSAFFIGKEGANNLTMLAYLAFVTLFLVFEVCWSLRLANRMAREKGLE
jgi:hypothetical protein